MPSLGTTYRCINSLLVCGFCGDRVSRVASMFLRFGGGVAQLVERYVRNVEVGGSSPLTSTDRCPS